MHVHRRYRSYLGDTATQRYVVNEDLNAGLLERTAIDGTVATLLPSSDLRPADTFV